MKKDRISAPNNASSKRERGAESDTEFHKNRFLFQTRRAIVTRENRGDSPRVRRTPLSERGRAELAASILRDAASRLRAQCVAVAVIAPVFHARTSPAFATYFEPSSC